MGETTKPSSYVKYEVELLDVIEEKRFLCSVRFEGGLVEVGLALVTWSGKTAEYWAWGLIMRCFRYWYRSLPRATMLVL